MHSTYNEGKSVVAKRFIKNLKYNIYKHMTADSKNVYLDVLNNLVDKCNNTFRRTMEMKPIDVKSDSYAEHNVDSNEKDPKYKVGDHVRNSSKNFFLLNDILQIGQKKSLLLVKLKKQFYGLMLLLI